MEYRRSMTPSEHSTEPTGLTVQTDGPLATVTMTRPAALNAFDTDLQHAMRAALDRLSAERRVRCILITGSGRAFCSGADIALGDLSDDVRLAPAPKRNSACATTR